MLMESDSHDRICDPSRVGASLFVAYLTKGRSSELRLILLWCHDNCDRCNDYQAATDSALRLASLQEHFGMQSRPWV